jgi:hypothetical protein
MSLAPRMVSLTIPQKNQPVHSPEGRSRQRAVAGVGVGLAGEGEEGVGAGEGAGGGVVVPGAHVVEAAAPAAITAAWIRGTVFSTSGYVAAVAALAGDRAVRGAVRTAVAATSGEVMRSLASLTGDMLKNISGRLSALTGKTSIPPAISSIPAACRQIASLTRTRIPADGEQVPLLPASAPADARRAFGILSTAALALEESSA